MRPSNQSTADDPHRRRGGQARLIWHRAESGPSTRSASPTTAVTRPAGPSIGTAASCTCWGVTAASRWGCSRSQPTSWPSLSRSSSVSARPDWVAVDSAIDPTRYCAVAATSSAPGGRLAIRPSSYDVSSSAGAVTSVATSAVTVVQEPAAPWLITLYGLYVYPLSSRMLVTNREEK